MDTEEGAHGREGLVQWRGAGRGKGAEGGTRVGGRRRQMGGPGGAGEGGAWRFIGEGRTAGKGSMRLEGSVGGSKDLKYCSMTFGS